MNHVMGCRRGAWVGPGSLLVVSLGALALTGCKAEVSGPSPTVGADAASPRLLCAEQHPTEGTPVVITGDGFSATPVFDGDARTVVLPTVTLTQSSDLTGAAGDASGVTFDGTPDGANGSALSWQSEQQMTFQMTDALGLSPGVYDLTVTNLNGNTATGAGAFAVVPPPAITGTAPSVCVENAPSSVTITGTSFLTVDGVLPTATADGSAVNVSGVGGCTDLVVAGVQSCTELTLDLPQQSLATPADIEVVVTNPPPADCMGSAPAAIHIVIPPTLTDVVPDHICADQQESFTVTGTNLEPGATVAVGTTMADSVTVNGTTEAVASFDNGLPPGQYDVTVDNGGGCAATLVSAITVEPTPIVFFVDPPVVYNDINLEVTIYASNLNTPPTSVKLVDSSGNETEITDFSTPVRPSRIQAVIPKGLPADDYEVHITSEFGCLGVLPGGVKITDQLTLALDSVDPTFASPSKPTAVTLKARPPSGTEVDFVETPRAYLNPNPPVVGGTANPLRAVVFVSNDTVSAVVPPNMQPATYDLIVVNPTGEVGLLSQAIEVTSGEPPVITKVSPATYAANGNYDGSIYGSDFDTNGVTVSLSCQQPGGGGAVSQAATVNNITATQVDVTFPTSSMSSGMICVVELVNDSGPSFLYSAVSITTSSYNLAPWLTGGNTPPPMSEGRRALALAAGRPTEVSRYLYAIGGDDGTAAGTKTSVESTRVGVFGEVSGWNPQRYALPEARAFAGYARLGRFIYLTGGTNGTDTTQTTWRAQILDPLSGPEIIDLDVALGDGVNGLTGGTWHYQIAATFGAGDASNPDGDSLPGEVQVVQLPDRSERLALTLEWAPITGASGYKVFRTPAAGDPASAVELIATITDGATVTWTDDGTQTTTGERTLPPGSLGTWHAVSDMKGFREGHATAIVPKPGSTTEHLIYAVGGRDENGGYRDDFEYAVITVAADGSQTVSAWTLGTGTLATPRADLGLFVLTPAETSLLTGDEVAIYVGPGRTATGAYNSLEVAKVPTDGDVQAWLVGDRNVTPTRYGYGSGASNGWLYIFGGGDGTNIRNTSVSATPGAALELFQSGAWNSVSINMADDRMYPGSAQESAFYFVAGGDTGAGVTASVDQTIQ